MPEGRTRFTVRRFAELDSTNRYLVDEARAGEAEGLVVVADYQTAGRGRLDRRWVAPAGTNLLVSVLLRPDLRMEELHLCTVAMALAARSACAQVADLEPTLKWPNDVMVGERKLAGILAESVAGSAGRAGSGGLAIVVGLGLNVGWPPPDDHSPAEDDREGGVPDYLVKATSIRRETGSVVEPGDLLAVLLGELERRVVALAGPEGRRELASEYRRVCRTLGRRVTVSLGGEAREVPEETVTGRVMDITEEGHLLVDVGACIRTISAGDVVHLRT